ncbi:MAG: ribosome small subunit-dependent GTPase A [Candidatus Margulisbacteria bacterium]|nr:ribosome small subunit-dependent GTPase A [Candidatus Margulisiibacteriota bacterium]
MTEYIDLAVYGFDDYFSKQISDDKELYAVRVASQHHDIYQVLGKYGEMRAQVSGRLIHLATAVTDYPAVGDWVLVDRENDNHGDAIIHRVLSRRSMFTRIAAGTVNQSQIVAANIDELFICMSLNQDYNLRRLERYLSIAWNSGAKPIVILTKSDLCNDLPDKLREVQSIASSVDIVVTSCIHTNGIHDLAPYLTPRHTVAFIGSSGVGKSTLINRLLGSDVLHTMKTRKDDKGRHATTHRQLLLLPNGVIVIDTPGMREIHLDTADIAQVFTDIENLAAGCKYHDCNHGTEPGCKVREALETGELSTQRLDSYLKLQKELGYQGLSSRQVEEKKIRHMFGSKGQMKQAMDYVKRKKDL